MDQSCHEPSHSWFDFWWPRYYSAIYRANTVLDWVPDIPMDADRKAQILVEARFLRAFNYFYLHDLWGPTPIILTSETSVDDRPTRPSKAEFDAFLTNEFTELGAILPLRQEQYGRATRGAALGFLTRFYLNNKEWEEAAFTAKQIMDDEVYTIYDPSTTADRDRNDLFATDNQYNEEFIYVIHYADDGAIRGGDGNTWLSHVAPPGYKWRYTNMVNFAAQFKIRDEFLALFDDPNDERLNAFLFEYENQGGQWITLGKDDVRSFKYPEDPEGTTDVTSNDVPLLRYADVLLMRAEALNELNGPNQESIDLINDVRLAANVYPIELVDFSSTETLKNFILDERGREFHSEFLRRQDLIRHGKFIEMARDRGKPAADHHVRFPIPRAEIDRNPRLEQNVGY